MLKASIGLNLALHYLSGAITFDPTVTTIDAKLASQIVWLDCLLINMDRTARNTNMLIWHKELWLIDHGASFYFHHSFTEPEKHALETLYLKYEWRSTLCRLGVVACAKPPRLPLNRFWDNGGYAPPPPLSMRSDRP